MFFINNPNTSIYHLYIYIYMLYMTIRGYYWEKANACGYALLEEDGGSA